MFFGNRTTQDHTVSERSGSYGWSAPHKDLPKSVRSLELLFHFQLTKNRLFWKISLSFRAACRFTVGKTTGRKFAERGSFISRQSKLRITNYIYKRTTSIIITCLRQATSQDANTLVIPKTILASVQLLNYDDQAKEGQVKADVRLRLTRHAGWVAHEI